MPKFEKGQSGNPGGRPKASIRFNELVKEHSEKALKVLVDALDSQSAKIRITAASIILDRAFGKPAQEIQGMNLSQVMVMNDIIRDGAPKRYNIGRPDEQPAADP